MPLSKLSRGDLELLRRAITRRQIPTPISEIGLRSIGRERLFSKLGPLREAPEAAALALIDYALAGGGAVAGGAPAAVASLVWTGPEVALAAARPTTAVLLELFGAAQQRVMIAGYEFDHGAVIFEPLYKAMVERGVKVAVYLDIRPLPSPKAKVDAYLALAAHKFLKRNWPFGAPIPELFYFPDGTAHGSRKSFHPKCVVVDGRQLLVGSANFTKRGHTRNVEVGVRLDDAALGGVLCTQFERLVQQGDLVRLPAALGPADRPPVEVEDAEEDAVAAPVSDADRIADELFVSDEARGLFARLLAAGVPVPDVGEDIEGDDGEVIGSPELSWPGPRVAVLLPEQEGSRKKLEAADWACVGLDLTDDQLAALCERASREG